MHCAYPPASDLRTIGPARATVLTLVLSLVQPPRRATRLLSAADARYRDIGFVMDGASRMDYERRLAETKERLAAPAFESIWREGQALSLRPLSRSGTAGRTRAAGCAGFMDV